MTSDEINNRASRVLKQCDGLSPNDTARVLTVAMQKALDLDINALSITAAAAVGGELLPARKGVRHKAERDREVHRFIIEHLDRYTSGMQLYRMCRTQFGPARSPSKSAMYRYLEALRSASRPSQESSDE